VLVGFGSKGFTRRKLGSISVDLGLESAEEKLAKDSLQRKIPFFFIRTVDVEHGIPQSG